MRLLVIFAVLAGALAASLQSIQRDDGGDLLVAAAASLSGIAPDIGTAFRDVSGRAVRFNFGGSNTLARQIVAGARVDAFISADAAQMDVVELSGRVVPGTRANIIANQLAIIVSDARANLVTVDELAASSTQRIAIGDPAAVPAGVYARHWLVAKRLWHAIEPKVVPMPSSPAVVAAVSAGRADAGIVYVTDAHNRTGVRVVHAVPVAEAPPIAYPAAAIMGGQTQLARAFVTFLRSSAAQRIFESAGFRPLASR